MQSFPLSHALRALICTVPLSALVSSATAQCSLEIVGSTTIPGPSVSNSRGLEVQNGYAYATSANAWLKVFDVRTPEALVEVGTIPMDAGGLDLADGYLYVCRRGSGVEVFDVSDPAAPVSVGFMPSPSGAAALDVAVEGNRAYCLTDAPSFLTRVGVFDITDPTAPVLLSTTNVGISFPTSIEAEGDLFYVGRYFTGAFVWNASNPAAPFFSGRCETYQGTGNNLVSGSTVYVPDRQGVSVYDTSEPHAAGSPYPRVAILYGGSGPVVALGNDEVLYTSSYWQGGVRAVDVSDPQNPLIVGFLGGPYHSHLAVEGNYLFGMASGTGGSVLQVIAATGCSANLRPEVTITSPADGAVTRESWVTVSATVIDEAVPVVTASSDGLTTTELVATGAHDEYAGTLDLTLEGANGVSVIAIDDAGNETATSIVVYRDRIAPVIQVSPAEGTVVSTAIPSFGITVTDQTRTTITVDGSGAGVAEGPDGEVYGEVSASLTGSIPLWVEGPNSIQIEATDAAGNTTVLTRTVILDSTAPVVTITEPVNGACFGIGSFTEIPLIALIDDATATVVSGALSGSVAAGGGTLAGTTTLVEGVNSISVTATNPGLSLSGTETISVTLDTIAPTVEITAPEADACVRGTIEFHATISDALPGAVASAVFSVDGDALPFSELYTVDTTLLADGVHELRVDAIDVCGNAATSAITILVDNTAPEVELLNPSPMDWVAGTIGFDASASDSGTGLRSVTMRAANHAPATDGSMIYAAPVASSVVHGEVDTFAAMGEMDGDLELEVTAVDCAGNETTVAITVRVDNTAPAKAITSPADGSIVRCALKVEADASDPNLASVQFVIDGVSFAVLHSAPFEATFDTRQRLDGLMPITVIATDLAGNESSCTIHVTVDNLAFTLQPRSLQLKSKGGGRSVTATVEGQNAALVLQSGLEEILLCVPGGAPIPATAFLGFEPGWLCTHENHPEHRGHRKGHVHGEHGAESKLHLKFDRQQLIGSLRGAGHVNGEVDVLLKVIRNGETFVIGSSAVQVRN